MYLKVFPIENYIIFLLIYDFIAVPWSMSFLYLFEIYWVLIHDLDFSVLLKNIQYILLKRVYIPKTVCKLLYIESLLDLFKPFVGEGYGKTESHCVAQDILILSA